MVNFFDDVANSLSRVFGRIGAIEINRDSDIEGDYCKYSVNKSIFTIKYTRLDGLGCDILLEGSRDGWVPISKAISAAAEHDNSEEMAELLKARPDDYSSIMAYIGNGLIKLFELQ